MARYKEYSYEQTKLIPLSFDRQILPGTFEYTLNYLIDNEVDWTAPQDPATISWLPRLIPTNLLRIP